MQNFQLDDGGGLILATIVVIAVVAGLVGAALGGLVGFGLGVWLL